MTQLADILTGPVGWALLFWMALDFPGVDRMWAWWVTPVPSPYYESEVPRYRVFTDGYALHS